MRTFFSLRRPLPRRTLVFCHGVVQLGVVVGALLWGIEHSPWLRPVTWQQAWPTLALGVGVALLIMVGVRLFAELLMLPHHVGSQLAAPGSVITRSFERRPAVHAPDSAWVHEAQPPVEEDEGVIGSARVLAPRRRPGARSERPPRQEPEL